MAFAISESGSPRSRAIMEMRMRIACFENSDFFFFGHQQFLPSIRERVVRDRCERSGHRTVRGYHLSDVEHHLSGNDNLRGDGLHAGAHSVANCKYEPPT